MEITNLCWPKCEFWVLLPARLISNVLGRHRSLSRHFAPIYWLWYTVHSLRAMPTYLVNQTLCVVIISLFFSHKKMSKNRSAEFLNSFFNFMSTSGLCTRSIVQWSKRGLISGSFSVWFSQKKYQIIILSFFNLWVVLRIVFGHLFVEIKPPLRLFTNKVLSHKWININKTSNLVKIFW